MELTEWRIFCPGCTFKKKISLSKMQMERVIDQVCSYCENKRRKFIYLDSVPC
jgi:hypothetical protein